MQSQCGAKGGNENEAILGDSAQLEKSYSQSYSRTQLAAAPADTALREKLRFGWLSIWHGINVAMSLTIQGANHGRHHL